MPPFSARLVFWIEGRAKSLQNLLSNLAIKWFDDSDLAMCIILGPLLAAYLFYECFSNLLIYENKTMYAVGALICLFAFLFFSAMLYFKARHSIKHNKRKRRGPKPLA